MKRVYPVFAVLFLGLAGYLMFQDVQQSRPDMFLLVLVIVVVNLTVFWRQMRGLADEVVDGGTYLLVRKGGVEERVQLADVVNVDMQRFSNPRRLTLRLRKPGKLGDEIAFIPQAVFRVSIFGRHPLAESLIARIDRLRQQA